MNAILEKVLKGVVIGAEAAGVPGAKAAALGVSLIAQHKSEQDVWDGFSAAIQGTVQAIEQYKGEIVDEQALGAAIAFAHQADQNAQIAVTLFKKAIKRPEDGTPAPAGA